MKWFDKVQPGGSSSVVSRTAPPAGHGSREGDSWAPGMLTRKALRPSHASLQKRLITIPDRFIRIDAVPLADSGGPKAHR